MADAEHANAAISVVNLRVSYGSREILHGITFDVRKGETLVILGGSGSGKSTVGNADNSISAISHSRFPPL